MYDLDVVILKKAALDVLLRGDVATGLRVAATGHPGHVVDTATDAIVQPPALIACAQVQYWTRL